MAVALAVEMVVAVHGCNGVGMEDGSDGGIGMLNQRSINNFLFTHNTAYSQPTCAYNLQLTPHYNLQLAHTLLQTRNALSTLNLVIVTLNV